MSLLAHEKLLGWSYMPQETQSPLPLKTYRSKHPVEALRWTDTDENREQFTEWFDRHDAMFETYGAELVLPDPRDGMLHRVSVGYWIIRDPDRDEFIAMADPLFIATYEETP